MSARFTHSLLIYTDRLMHDALAWRCTNIYPLKSKADFVRDAIYEKLAREAPQAFQKKPEIIAAE
jgi:hypothetical protein